MLQENKPISFSDTISHLHQICRSTHQNNFKEVMQTLFHFAYPNLEAISSMEESLKTSNHYIEIKNCMTMLYTETDFEKRNQCEKMINLHLLKNNKIAFQNCIFLLSLLK